MISLKLIKLIKQLQLWNLTLIFGTNPGHWEMIHCKQSMTHEPFSLHLTYNENTLPPIILCACEGGGGFWKVCSPWMPFWLFDNSFAFSWVFTFVLSKKWMRRKGMLSSAQVLRIMVIMQSFELASKPKGTRQLFQVWTQVAVKSQYWLIPTSPLGKTRNPCYFQGKCIWHTEIHEPSAKWQTPKTGSSKGLDGQWKTLGLSRPSKPTWHRGKYVL